MAKHITTEGKKKLLRLGFLSDTERQGFNYLALGDINSQAAITGDAGNFSEVNSNNYNRVELVEEQNTDSIEDDTDLPRITLSAIFDKYNYSPSSDGYITEIGIVDRDYPDQNNQTFFAFSTIPKIDKSHNVSLKYTIILEIKDNTDD